VQIVETLKTGGNTEKLIAGETAVGGLLWIEGVHLDLIGVNSGRFPARDCEDSPGVDHVV
jgi:hypothetical protein